MELTPEVTVDGIHVEISRLQVRISQQPQQSLKRPGVSKGVVTTRDGGPPRLCVGGALVKDNLVGARRIQHEPEMPQGAVQNHVGHGRGDVGLEDVAQAARRELEVLHAAAGPVVAEEPGAAAVADGALDGGAGPRLEVEDEAVLFVEEGGAGGVEERVREEQVVRERDLGEFRGTYLDWIWEYAEVGDDLIPDLDRKVKELVEGAGGHLGEIPTWSVTSKDQQGVSCSPMKDFWKKSVLSD